MKASKSGRAERGPERGANLPRITQQVRLRTRKTASAWLQEPSTEATTLKMPHDRDNGRASGVKRKSCS